MVSILTFSLWGNPSHMEYLQDQIEKYLTPKNETLITYKSDSHAGFLTYDGVDINGKRISDEILTKTKELNQSGQVTKFSIIGYSLGGLISRYAIGILYNQGYFDTIEPINFITFCSPHVGVPHPKNSRAMAIYDAIAPKFLAATGDQIFLRDKVVVDGDSNPILVRLAGIKSIFFIALSKFKYRVLYANAVNDKRCAFFTALISEYDPFHSLSNKNPERIEASYVKNYEPTVVDLSKPINITNKILRKQETERTWNQFFIRKYRWLIIFMKLFVYSPFWGLTFLSNSIIERFKYNGRLSKIKQDKSINFVDLYQPVRSRSNRGSIDGDANDLFTNFERDTKDRVYDQKEGIVENLYGAINYEVEENQNEIELNNSDKMNLSVHQKTIVKNLNTLSWTKHPIIIRQTKATHAASIHRHDDPNFEEGKVVVKHFVDNSFRFD